MMRRNLTIPHRLMCVTDSPEGIDIDTMPLPTDFDGLKSAAWSEAKDCPQCYRRITLFSPAAAEIFGADRFVSMDMDCIVTGNIDHLFQMDDDFVMFRGTSGSRPYNGSMVMMTAGARSQVYTRLMEEGKSLVDAAQKKYLGSDQAIISYVLGRGERVWNQEEGVYFWSPKFKRQYRGKVPENMCLLFFPGHPKPWQALEYPYIRDHWHDGEPHEGPDRKPAYAMPCLYAYNDKKGWGRRLHESASKRGIRVVLFKSPFTVPKGSTVFLRMDQQGSTRRISKVLSRKLSERRCIMFPSKKECDWYDDKAAQYPDLCKWMPETLVTSDTDKAMEWARTNSLPFVSKLSRGASSENVRLINSVEEAYAVATSQRQVYWQKLIPTEYDYRITIVGDCLFGLKRYNRPNDFRASGSGNFEYLDFKDAESKKAARLALKAAHELGICWTAFDVVMDGKTPLLLEMSSSWHWQSNADVPMFDHKLKPVEMIGKDCLKILTNMMRDAKHEASATV
jgi:hypothetical protein